MAKFNKSFWIALLSYCQDHEELRVRLWNGYIGWKLPNQLKGDKLQSSSSQPQFVVDAPPDEWPELTKKEMSLLNEIAAESGGPLSLCLTRMHHLYES